MDAPAGAPPFFQAEASVFEGLSSQDIANLVAKASDLAVVLDRAGIVRDLAFSEPDLPSETFDGWIGRHFSDTVTTESRAKIEKILSVTRDDPHPFMVQVNHPREGAEDLPIRYSATALSDDRLIAIGRDLSPLAVAQRRLLTAQRMAEREYRRLRNSEARYRQYFHVTDEPVLFVDASERITEANPAAQRLWPNTTRLTGRRIAEALEPSEREAFAEAMAAARLSGASQLVEIGERRLVLAPLRYEPGAVIVRFADAGETHLSPHEKLVRVVEAMPDAFIVTDWSFSILVANAAFVAMTEAASIEHVLGSSLEQWLGRPGVDISVIRSALSEGGTLRGFATVVQGELGRVQDVEVSAVRVTDARGDYVGLSIREGSAPEAELAPRSAQQIADLVGRVPVKDIVRRTTDTIERMCIEAALELSSDNRASAAELLGLSRQSLYVKMRRYGIVEGDTEPEDN